MKQYSYREFITILKKNGYMEVRSKGDHHIFEKTGMKHHITINDHPNICVCQRLIKTYGLVC